MIWTLCWSPGTKRKKQAQPKVLLKSCHVHDATRDSRPIVRSLFQKSLRHHFRQTVADYGVQLLEIRGVCIKKREREKASP